MKLCQIAQISVLVIENQCRPNCNKNANINIQKIIKGDIIPVMWCLEALPRLEAASRQNFHCLSLVLGLEP